MRVAELERGHALISSSNLMEQAALEYRNPAQDKVLLLGVSHRAGVIHI